ATGCTSVWSARVGHSSRGVVTTNKRSGRLRGYAFRALCGRKVPTFAALAPPRPRRPRCSIAVEIDRVLAKLAQASYGPFLLGSSPAGLIAFELYSLSEARYRRI